MNGPNVRENDSIVSVHFDSILDFMNHKETGKNQEMFEEDTRRSRREGSYWIGKTNKTVGDVIEHALMGDEVLHKSLEAKVKSLEAMQGLNEVGHVQKVKSVRRVLEHSRQGDEIDIHKVYSGKLDTAWSKRVRVTQDDKHPLVTLHIDIGGAGSVEAEESLWRAVVALRVFEDLTRAGKSVKIIVGGCSTGVWRDSARSSAQSITVKEYNEGLSVERLAAMTHIGFYRVFGFAAKAAQDINRLSSGYGYSSPAGDKTIAINLQEELADGHSKFIYIGRSTSASDAHNDLKSVYKQLTEES